MKSIFKLGLFALMSFDLSARYHLVKNANQLERLVDGYEYSVVCFAHSGQGVDEELDRDDKKERKKEFRTLQDVVRSASQRAEYADYLKKDVGFIVVDVAAKNAQDASREYEVGAEPICFVFEQGAIDKKQKVVRPAAARDLIKLLEQEGGKDLKQLLFDRKEQASLARQERIAQYYAYGAAYPYMWDYGWYPYGRRVYWGGGYGWYGW